MRAFPVSRVTSETLRAAVKANVHPNAAIVTDELPAYRKVGQRRQRTVHHASGEYVRGDVHPNSVEGFFSLLRRGINGTFHHVSKGHLHRYVSESAFRYHNRAALGVTDGERAQKLVRAGEGKP